jgi:hypothetical protein
MNIPDSRSRLEARKGLLGIDRHGGLQQCAEVIGISLSRMQRMENAWISRVSDC